MVGMRWALPGWSDRCCLRTGFTQATPKPGMPLAGKRFHAAVLPIRADPLSLLLLKLDILGAALAITSRVTRFEVGPRERKIGAAFNGLHVVALE